MNFSVPANVDISGVQNSPKSKMNLEHVEHETVGTKYKGFLKMVIMPTHLCTSAKLIGEMRKVNLSQTD